MEKIILASASPRRREILEKANIRFDIITADIDESMDDKIAPCLAAQQIALKKAAAVSKKVSGSAYVISADTIVCVEDRVLGKPRDEEEAFEMLTKLSGNSHEVITGVCIMQLPGCKAATFCDRTRVYFNKVSGDEISEYIKSGEPMDKAGAYGIQGKGSFLVSKIEGDYQNVVGLPIDALISFAEKEFSLSLNVN
jgi:septum formation protein